MLGYELPQQSKQARMEMGVVPQLDNLDVELTCRQILMVFARLYRVARAERPAAVRRALALANLSARADTIVRELSGGMRRRLLVARGLIHEPRLVLLDEPTVGLDPQVRQELWSLIDGLRARGVTVLMSTHYIEEAERLADTVAVMSHGQIIAQGTPGELVRRARRRAGARGLRAAAASGRGQPAGAEQRLEQPAQRPRGGDPARGDARRPGARRRAPPGQPRGRVRRADRGARSNERAGGCQRAGRPRTRCAGWNRPRSRP